MIGRIFMDLLHCVNEIFKRHFAAEATVAYPQDLRFWADHRGLFRNPGPACQNEPLVPVTGMPRKMI
jgi:hypothetical protein